MKAIYDGTKQAAMQFWKKLCSLFKSLTYERSKADPCMHFKWTDAGLVIFLSWVDDMLICGPEQEVLKAKQEFTTAIECDDQGELEEYVGCKVNYDKEKGRMKFTQPVMIQSFNDEFKLPSEAPVIPATAGDLLKREDGNPLSKGDQTTYRSGVGKLLHMRTWSRNDILNRTRELSRYMQQATDKHLNAMYKVMNYVIATKEKGNIIHPMRKWNGKDRDHKFRIGGRSDSEFATDPETRRSVSAGHTAFLEGSPFSARSRMQKCVTLSVTEAEFVSGADCVQDMLYCMRLLESIGLQVEKPMILEMDNKGAVDLVNNWSATGHTRHICTKINFLRELKEEGLLKVVWLSNEFMSSDIFTKNVGGADFHKHSKVYIGE
jgi:hypothetical protein